MLISEIFYSIQGEGKLTGMPSVFVRTSGCNLRCRWCDTPYASWKPTGTQMTVEEIVGSVKAHPARHVVLTGGEPMVAPEIGELASALRKAKYHITIETAGTVAVANVFCDLASVSPKLVNSTPLAGEIGETWRQRHEARRWNLDAIISWLRCPDYQIKFVVSAPEDLVEIEKCLGSPGINVPPEQVFLMPEGRDVASLAARKSWLLATCLEKGYRYCHRLHIELFGNTPGT